MSRSLELSEVGILISGVTSCHEFRWVKVLEFV